LEKIKAVSVLKTFTESELKKFEDFLNSPYFNKGKRYITRFYEELTGYHPDYSDQVSFKKEVYKILYPKERYNDVRFRKLSSELYKLLLEYLAVESFTSDQILKREYVLSQLNQRTSGNLFEPELKKSYFEMHKTGLRNDQFYKHMYELISKEKFYYFQRKRSRALDLYDPEMTCFAKYSLSLFLLKYIERTMEMRFFKAQKFDLPLFGEIITFIRKNDMLNDPFINILYLQLSLCLKDDDESYFKLRKLLYKEERKLDRNQIKIIYTILSNYAAERAEKGVPGFPEEILSINLEIIKKDLTEQYISGFLFVNIVTLFLKFKKIKELKRFTKGNSEKLNPEIKEAVLNYCYSCLAFNDEDFESALVYLSKINFDHYQLKFRIKNLTLKIYYEQKQYDAIYSLMDSYRHILKRETDIPDSIKKTISAFLKFLKELTDIKTSKKKNEKRILTGEFENSSPAEKQWLKEKIDELSS